MHTAEVTHVVAAQQLRAFDNTIVADLTHVLGRRFLLIPGVAEVLDQSGTWSSVGETRTIVFADGGRVREELLSVDRPHAFSYDLHPVSGLLAQMATRMHGSWTFAPDPEGTRIRWRLSVEPGGPLALLAPVFLRLWRPFARRCLARLDDLLGT